MPVAQQAQRKCSAGEERLGKEQSPEEQSPEEQSPVLILVASRPGVSSQALFGFVPAERPVAAARNCYSDAVASKSCSFVVEVARRLLLCGSLSGLAERTQAG